MIEKYRVHEVAKDLNVPSKDIINLLSEHFEEPKKHMTALTEPELNVVFEHYTQKTQVKNFDEYFAMTKEAEPAKSKPKKDTAPKAEAPKADTPKAEAPKAEAVKSEPVKAEAKIAEPAKTDAPKAEAPRAEKPQGDRPQGGYNNNRPQGDRPQGGYNNNRPQGDRPQGGYNNNRPQGDRPQGGYNNNRPQGDRPQGGYNNNRPQGDRPQGGYNNNRPQGDRPQGGYNNNRPQGDRPQGGYNNNRPQGDRPQGGYNNNRPQGDRPQGGYNNNRPQGDRPQGGYNNNRPQGDRPQGGYNNNRPQGDRPQGGYNNNRPQNNNAPTTRQNETYKVAGGFNEQRAMGGKVKSGTQPAAQTQERKGSTQDGPVVVDMRAAHVELDKYNERYENIAPSNLTSRTNDNIKKQKINQRSSRRGRPVMSKGQQEAEKMRRLELERQRRQKLEITLPEEITVGDLAARLKIQSSEIIKRLMVLGIMASVSQLIDYDTASMVAMEIGAKVSPEVVVTIEERLFEVEEDHEDNLGERSPIVVVMGHVDHGKTSLLDAIRNTNVTTGEAGGITQHIGAYQVEINDKKITFLDTPGHAAFTSMRARGAQVTDIAVLVVAADDGIMPQTIEAINHAKAAEVSIIVAINKIDKPDANPDKVKQELTEHGLVPEEWGGDVICVPVSAKSGENISTLLEMIQLVSDVKELRANADRMAKGTVIEAHLDKGKGPVATLLVQTGTLNVGDVIIAGTALGRVRVMMDDKGNHIKTAGPSKPVSITGLAEVPSAGDIFNAVEDERLAKELVDKRRFEAKEEQFKSYQKVTLDNLFSHISDGDIKELPVIVKADVQGSVEALKQSLEKLSNEEVRVKVIHGAVGAVSESDVMLANASNAIVIGFNVRPDPIARDNAERDSVDIRLYRIIYDALDEIESAMKGMLAPKTREVDLGRAEIRLVYKITGVGAVAGCYVTEGKITRNANIRVVRDGIIIADDKLASLKRFKDDVKDVARGFECGMSLEKYADIKEGDFFEAYIIEEYRD